MAISLILGVFIGMVLGLTGAGGGIFSVPALILGMGWTIQQAEPVALIAVAVGAAVGVIDGLRKQLVHYRSAAVMAATGLMATPLGFHVANELSQSVLTVLFVIVMLLVAFRMIRAKPPDVTKQGASKIARINLQTGRLAWNWANTLLLGAIGACTGFMAGLLGVGGGFVIVPLLRRFTNISMHAIIATTLLVITIVAGFGVIIEWESGAFVPLRVAVFFTSATVVGMVFGRWIAKHLNERHLQSIFAVLMILFACGLILRLFVK